jgi:hypothetical protein
VASVTTQLKSPAPAGNNKKIDKELFFIVYQ